MDRREQDQWHGPQETGTVTWTSGNRNSDKDLGEQEQWHGPQGKDSDMDLRERTVTWTSGNRNSDKDLRERTVAWTSENELWHGPQETVA